MKVLSIILTCALLGVMGWLVIDSKSKAKGAQNQLDLIRKQQTAKSGNPADAQLAELESQLLADRAKRNAAASAAPAPLPTGTIPPPVSPSFSPPPTANSPAVAAAIAAANAAPMPQTPRQRMISGAPTLAEVKQFAKDYGFVEITAGSGSKIEVGMGFAIRRGNAIIARIKVTDVEASSAVADVDSRSLPPGVIIETGDQVIQDLPPES